LAEAGIYVPRWSDPFLGTHTLHPLAIGQQGGVFDGYRGGYAAAQAKAWEDWANIEDEIAQTQPHTLVLSSELLFQPLTEHAGPFLQRLKALSSQIDVVAYLRAPNSFALSSLAQDFKHHTVTQLSRVEVKLDFKTILTSFETKIADSLMTYDFGKCRHDHGTVVKHFFGIVLGTEAPDSAASLFWNVTPSPEALLVLQDFFSRYYGAQSWDFTPEDYVLMAQMQKVDQAVAPAPRKLTTAACYWLGSISTDTDWLAQHHGIVLNNPPSDPASDGAFFATDDVTLDDIFVRDSARQTAFETALKTQAPVIWNACGPSAKARAKRLDMKLRRKAKTTRRKLRAFVQKSTLRQSS